MGCGLPSDDPLSEAQTLEEMSAWKAEAIVIMWASTRISSVRRVYITGAEHLESLAFPDQSEYRAGCILFFPVGRSICHMLLV